MLSVMPCYNAVMHTLVNLLANQLIFIPLVIFVMVLILIPADKKRAFVLQASIAAILSILLAKIGSQLFYNPRPFVVGHFTPYFPHGAENGFPSEHTLVASLIALLIVAYYRKLGIFLLLIAVIIGLARVKAGVHHLIDVIGAITITGIAYLCLIVISSAIKRIKNHT